MNAGIQKKVEGQWDQLRGEIKKTWGKVTDDDLDRADGQYTKLVGIIKEKTGDSQQEIERRFDNITSRMEEPRQR